MIDQRNLIITAITSLFALSVIATSASVYAAEEENCWGVAKAGQNACNSNKSRHSCAGHSRIENDPNDFIPLPKGSCLKIGGKLKPAGDKTKQPGKV